MPGCLLPCTIDRPIDWTVSAMTPLGSKGSSLNQQKALKFDLVISINEELGAITCLPPWSGRYAGSGMPSKKTGRHAKRKTPP